MLGAIWPCSLDEKSGNNYFLDMWESAREVLGTQGLMRESAFYCSLVMKEGKVSSRLYMINLFLLCGMFSLTKGRKILAKTKLFAQLQEWSRIEFFLPIYRKSLFSSSLFPLSVQTLIWENHQLTPCHWQLPLMPEDSETSESMRHSERSVDYVLDQSAMVTTPQLLDYI